VLHAFAVRLVPSFLSLSLSLPFPLLFGAGHPMHKVESCLDMVKNKQREFDETSSIAATACADTGEKAVNEALSVISLQSLIVLLRNPQVESSIKPATRMACRGRSAVC
jgi:hypothetical protein